MQTISDLAERHITRSSIGAVVALAAVIGTLLANGSSGADILIYSVYFVAVILAPGVIVWDWLMKRQERAEGTGSSARTSLEDVVCGACVGYGIELPSYAAARWLDIPRAYVAVPLAILISYVLTRPWRKQALRSERPGFGTGPALGLGIVLSYSALWLGARAFAPLPLRPAGSFADTDDPFQLSLIGELRHHFPGVYPYVPDEPLTYQYFFHLHAAASTWATGLSPMDVFARFDPMIFMMLAVTGAACVARRLSGRPWVGVVAAATLTLVGAFDISGLFRGQANIEDRFLSTLLVHASNQAMAFALVTPLVILALKMVEPPVRLTFTSWAAFVFLGVVMTGIKVTFMPMLLAGLAGTAILLFVTDRRRAVQAGIGAGLSLFSIILCFAVIYRGQSRGLSFHPLSVADHYSGFFQMQTTTWLDKVFVVASVLVGVLVPAAGIVGLLTRRIRSDPRAWMLLISGVSGLGALTLLGHSGLSQRYFLYSAAWFLAVASAWGLGVLFPPGEPASTYLKALVAATAAGLGLFLVRLVAEPRSVVRTLPEGMETRSGFPGSLNLPVVGAIILVFLAVAVVRRPTGEPLRFPRMLVVTFVGLGLARAMAFTVGDAPAAEPADPVAAEGIVATNWLREHADPDDVVMTNAHCIPVGVSNGRERCDNRHFWMSGLSERRFLLEGWGYVGTVEWQPYSSYVAHPELLAENDRLFTDATEQSLRTFAAAHGVRWMLADRSLPVDLSRLEAIPGVRPVIINDDFALLELR